MRPLTAAASRIADIEPRTFEGRVVGVSGLLIAISGPPEALSLGSLASIQGPAGEARGEIVGFSEGDRALVLPFDEEIGRAHV